jgi:hypothetical protein
MSWELAQHIGVTIIAVAAAGVLLQQVAAFVWPKKDAPACANCASRKASPSSRLDANGGKTVMTVPVIRGRSARR